MNNSVNIKEYYKTITNVDIVSIAREILPNRITTESSGKLHCNCPNHNSTSKMSLHIDSQCQKWHCFACNVGGDVLHLVEFIQSGTITKGVSGKMPASHVLARDFLAAKVGLPPLSTYGLSPEQLSEVEANRIFENKVYECFTQIALFYHNNLQNSPEILQFVKEKWNISDETIKNLLIGYSVIPSNNQPGILSFLRQQNFTDKEILATGCFKIDSNEQLKSFFKNRITFPYWKSGNVVYMIGRQTPNTPNVEWEKGKYKKSLVHNEHDHRYVAQFIDNGTLYNEDVLLSNPDYVVITEGVTDCISLMEHDIPAISPVTISLKDKDWDRIIKRLHNVKNVYICQDNEISEAGFKGACRMSQKLRAAKIKSFVATLPLNEKQITARELLLQAPDDSDLKADAKIDVNEWFATGKTDKADEFKNILSNAKTTIDFGIDRILSTSNLDERNAVLIDVLSEIASLPAIEHDEYLKKIYDKTNKTISRATLKAQIKEIKKEQEQNAKAFAIQQAKQKKIESFTLNQSVTPGASCRAAIEAILVDYEFNKNHSMMDSPFIRAGEVAFNWFESNGAKFYRAKYAGPFMFYNHKIYYLDSSDREKRHDYFAFMQRETGMVNTSQSGRTFFETFKNLTVERGHKINEFSWTWTDTVSNTVYFNLNNNSNELIRISPKNIEIIYNGGNFDNIVLSPSEKIKAINYIPDVDILTAEHLLQSIIIDNLTCSPEERLIIKLWTCTFLLIGYLHSKAILRFEGAQGSGKSTASEVISYLIYGKDWKKHPTLASNYADAVQSPFLIIDNIETKNLTEPFVDFLLMATTDIVKEKRRAGTDSEIITERANCLININGIEPLSGPSASEILTRTIICNFDTSFFRKGMIKERMFSEIKKNRDIILSGLFKKTQIILQAITAGQMENMLVLIEETLGNHHKSRCNEFLALMLLYHLIGSTSAEDQTIRINEFFTAISAVNINTMEIAADTNPISNVLQSLFSAWNNAKRLDNNLSLGGDIGSRRKFIDIYNIEIKNNIIFDIRANDLFSTLKKFARTNSLEFPYSNVKQFARRFSNDKNMIEQNGIQISTKKDRDKFTLYTIKDVSSENNHESNKCSIINNEIYSTQIPMPEKQIDFYEQKQIKNLNDIKTLGGNR